MTNDETRIDAVRRSSFGLRHSLVILASASVLSSAGCQFNKPNKANIALRKESQAQQAQIAKLTAQHDADAAQARAMQSANAVPTLPVERLEKLFTTSSLKFKNIAIGDDTDPARPGDEGFKVAVTPVDQVGDEFKAAGALTIELFDLANGTSPRIGTWSLSTDEARPKWLSTPVFDGYLIAEQWQAPPAHARLLVKATFVDELTGRSFEAQRELTVNPPPTTTTTTTMPATTQP